MNREGLGSEEDCYWNPRPGLWSDRPSEIVTHAQELMISRGAEAKNSQEREALCRGSCQEGKVTSSKYFKGERSFLQIPYPPHPAHHGMCFAIISWATSCHPGSLYSNDIPQRSPLRCHSYILGDTFRRERGSGFFASRTDQVSGSQSVIQGTLGFLRPFRWLHPV